MPLLRTYAGGGVALANRAAALNAPVVCNPQILSTELDGLKKKILNNEDQQISTRHCLFLVSMSWYLY
jgi:adenylosuccinate synthase